MNSQLLLWSRRLAGVATLAFMAACGGGGGDATPGASAALFNVDAAVAATIRDTSTLNYLVTGTASGVPLSGGGTLNQSALTDSAFEGQLALRKVSTATGNVEKGGVVTPGTDVVQAFYDAQLRPLGQSSEGFHSVRVLNTSLPDAARVGETGVYLTTLNYTDSGKQVPLGRSTWLWALEPDTTETAILRLVETRADNIGGTVSTAEVRFRITSSGTLLGRLGETTTSVTSNTRLEVTYR